MESYNKKTNENVKCVIKDNYRVYKKSAIPFELMDSSPDTQMPKPPKNAGLYGGVEEVLPWLPKSEIATATNYMKLLESANPIPPPGATKQYVSIDRLGNNFSPAPKVKWYAKTTKVNCGPFNIKGL